MSIVKSIKKDIIITNPNPKIVLIKEKTKGESFFKSFFVYKYSADLATINSIINRIHGII